MPYQFANRLRVLTFITIACLVALLSVYLIINFYTSENKIITRSNASNIAIKHLNEFMPAYNKVTINSVKDVEYNHESNKYIISIDPYPDRTLGYLFIEIDASNGKVLPTSRKTMLK